MNILLVIIVYYAPREEKTWTVYSSCKLPSEGEGGKHEMWGILLPWSEYYFSSHKRAVN